MFKNKYIMNKIKYIKWMLPKFYLLPIFYIGLALIAFSLYGLFNAEKLKIPGNISFAFILLILISLYYMFAFNFIKVVKKYRGLIDKDSINKDLNCECKISGENLSFSVEGKVLSSFYLSDATNFTVAKSYSAMFDKNGNAILFDNGGFVDSSLDEFKDYLGQKFKNITIQNAKDRYNN